MVKGISRQVIVVQSPDPKLFEQAIFILKDNAVGQEGVTEEALLKESNRMISKPQKRSTIYNVAGPIWACAGGLVIGILWFITAMF